MRYQTITVQRLALRSRINTNRIKEMIGGINDRRFLALQKRLIKDLDGAKFKTISLKNYMRLGGWSHTGGSYVNTMSEVRKLCEFMFGYSIPERIGNVYVKVYRYASAKRILKIAGKVSDYHQKHLK